MTSEIKETPSLASNTQKNNILKDLGIQSISMPAGIEVTIENLKDLLLHSKDAHHA